MLTGQCAASIICSLTVIIMTFFVLRTLRRMDCRPTYLPGKYLKEKWTQWRPGVKYGQVPDQPPQTRAQDTAYRGPGPAGPEGGTEMTTTTPGTDGIQRDTSVRSTITLPAYSSSPNPTEQIIAREGERAGMDVVVEFPETAEEEESRREGMMESLYQIRLQRRREVNERNARRQARREAREQGNTGRVEQLRLESQARRRDRSATNTSERTASMALREHRARSSDGRISRVNYASLGCVRHDGSRVRGNSAESDNRPLLDASAPLGGHSRGDSASSLASASSLSDVDTLNPAPSHPQSARESMSGPSEGPDNGDVGAHSIPPPDYEHLDWGEAPAYDDRSPDHSPDHSPDRSPGVSPLHSPENPIGNPPELRLPELTPLPAIQIDTASPVSPSPVTPTNPATPTSATPQTNANTQEHSEARTSSASGSTVADSSSSQ